MLFYLFQILKILIILRNGRPVCARMVGATITKIVQMFGIARGTISKVMIGFEKRNCLSKAQVWPKAKVVSERPSNFTSNC